MDPKIVLITGCSSGIGMVVAAGLAKDTDKRYTVYATMRNLDKKADLERTAGSALNETLFILELDVTKEDTIERAVAEILAKHGRIDVLFNNAGVAGFEIFENADFQYIRDIMEVNYFGAARMIQKVLPGMKQRQSGRIINMSSTAGIFGQPHCATYSSSKFALEGLTESLAIELRPHGIWATSLVAGPIHSKVLENQISNRDLAEDQRIDSKSRASLKATFEVLDRIYSPDGLALPTKIMLDVVHRAVEDEKPHLRYRCTPLMWKDTKYRDEHGDAYVDDMTKNREK